MPYRRHSVWIDVFGVVALLVLLLVPLGVLATEMMGGGGSGGGGGAIVDGGGPPAPQPSPRARPFGKTPRPPSLLGDGASARGESSVQAPFSDTWQEQATPDLTGPTGLGAAPSGGSRTVGSEAPESTGPTIASRGSRNGAGGGVARSRSAGNESGWRSEARRLSGRTRALAGQLRQMERASAEETGPAREEKSSTAASGGRGAASTSSDPGTPNDPNQVPIGDHLHWLATLGILWGVWRLRGGA